MADACFLGIDGGTEGVRAGLFDERGNALAYASKPYPTHFPRPGWAEQRPQDWWPALVTAVREAVATARVAPDQVRGIAVDATSCSVVALDADAEPVRPALIWMDVRSGDQAGRIAASGAPALRVNGAGHGPVSAEWFLPKALWIKENEPELFEKATTVCEYVDYLNFRLTGRMVASLNNAAIRWHYDSRRGGFQRSLMDEVGLCDLADRLPKDVLPMGARIDGLSAVAAAELGLEPGTPVSQGGADAFVAMIGLGVVRPGKLAFITGSSHLHLGLSRDAFHAEGLWGTYPDAVIQGLHTIEGGQTSTGSVVAWLRSLLPEADADFANLNAKAAALPPGAEGLLVLEHFQGNRTPHTDPDARGVITGLTLKHRSEHLYRAVLEGVAFGSELILETMRGADFVPDEIVMCGGATRSELWPQIHADVSNLPITLTATSDAPALGCAVLAAVGAGYHGDIPSAAAAMVHPGRTIEPDADRHGFYAELYAVYRELYPALAGLTHRQATFARSSALTSADPPDSTLPKLPYDPHAP